MPEEDDKSKKEKDAAIRRSSWKPDETQIRYFNEALEPKSSKETKEKEKSKDEKPPE